MSKHHHHAPKRSLRDMNRRVFLKSGSLAFFSATAAPRFLDRLALAAPGASRPRRPTLVTIFLRGAMDSLMAVPPLVDPHIATLRPRLEMSAARSRGADLLDLDGVYGLHPSLAPLYRFFDEGRLAIVHGVGSPHPTRSHFDAQDYMETGVPERKGVREGWLNRAAGAIGATSSPFRAVAIGPELPRSLAGPAPALAIDDLSRFDLLIPEDQDIVEQSEEYLEELWMGHAEGLLSRRGREMYQALDILSDGALDRYRAERAGRYPDSKLGRDLLQIAFLIRAGVGLEIAFAESDGWDTHVAQGTVQGAFAGRADDLARAVAAFWDDIEPFHDDVVVLTMTEFGRTVRENGSGGTDHGHGGCLFTLGNRVDGGRIYGSVPELAPENLYEGRDLPVDVDFRSVFAEVTGKLFNLRDDQAVFPGWQGTRLPILW